MGQAPTLQLDDGRALTQSVSIWRCLQQLYPDPPLFGEDAFNAAEIDTLIRRVEDPPCRGSAVSRCACSGPSAGCGGMRTR